MKSELLLREFDRLSEAPDAVSRCRQVILELAVQGYLADTDHSTDKRSTLRDACSLVVDGDHNPPPRVAEGIPYVTAKNVTDRGLELTSASRVSTNEWSSRRVRYHPEEDDVLITCVGTLGRTAIVSADTEFLIDRNVAALRPNEHVLPRYLKVALDAPSTQRFLTSASGKTAQPHIYLKDLRRTKVRIPCRDEQARIVAKADALMEICDELENAQEQRTASEAVVGCVASALDRAGGYARHGGREGRHLLPVPFEPNGEESCARCGFATGDSGLGGPRSARVTWACKQQTARGTVHEDHGRYPSNAHVRRYGDSFCVGQGF